MKLHLIKEQKKLNLSKAYLHIKLWFQWKQRNIDKEKQSYFFPCLYRKNLHRVEQEKWLFSWNPFVSFHLAHFCLIFFCANFFYGKNLFLLLGNSIEQRNIKRWQNCCLFLFTKSYGLGQKKEKRKKNCQWNRCC